MADQEMFAEPKEAAGKVAAATSGGIKKNHQVVALRYRPQNFKQLVGQESVWKGLAGAIQSQRVGHAYLFTGARGVGKTSTARIFAKCLNCVDGPTTTPCGECDSCQGIESGQDIDVIEMDAASNRGIDNIRDLRQSAIIRPTRSRNKIYILDEVHMLSKDAFNALLKTLEEPPGHVKFIFCTTEVDKIPITILSRCQRFDFGLVETTQIAKQLAYIAAQEDVQVEPEALDLLARRAGGSMRDSQSLLEQLLAFGTRPITVNDVHALLGTTDNSRLNVLLEALAARDTSAAIDEFAQALAAGADVGQLFDQLLGCLRDLMVVAVGGSRETLLHHAVTEYERVRALAQKLGLETILAMLQIADQTLARLRSLNHPRILAEVALVRMSRLAQLQSISQLVAALKSGNLSALTLEVTGTAGQMPASEEDGDANLAKKKTAEPEQSLTEHEPEERQPPVIGVAATTPPPTPDSPGPPAIENLSPAETATQRPPIQLSDNEIEPAAILTAWEQTLAELNAIAVESARQAENTAILAPNKLVLTFSRKYNFAKQTCERPENCRQLEAGLAERCGSRIKLVFQLSTEPEPAEPVEPIRTAPHRSKPTTERLQHPFVKRAVELFAARVVHVEEPETA